MQIGGGVGGPSLSPQDFTEVDKGLDVLGPDRQRLPKVIGRLVKPSQRNQGRAKVVVGIGIAGVDLECPAIMNNGVVDLPAVGQSIAEVVVGFREEGLNFQALRKWAMASSRCPRAASREPRLTWATQFLSVHSKSRVHSAALSRQ